MIHIINENRTITTDAIDIMNSYKDTTYNKVLNTAPIVYI